jgi:hypothetical protein
MTCEPKPDLWSTSSRLGTLRGSKLGRSHLPIFLYGDRSEFANTCNSPTEGRDEFTMLAGMGVKILPLVVYKLGSESEATAVELCELPPTR